MSMPKERTRPACKRAKARSNVSLLSILSLDTSLIRAVALKARGTRALLSLASFLTFSVYGDRLRSIGR